jgi:hypothetical protein
MYLVALGWMYVVLMMAVAEATASNGTVLGAIITFFLYGVGPLALLMYIMGTPGRKKALRARHEAELQAARQQGDGAGSADAPPTGSAQPDGGGEAPADAVSAVRKEP